ncbi:hypothetical protein E2C00_07200 [Streptomyces sp. WAC05374]|uniref:hypothetical protein n=1 Tax=Streptomyces sp. WAC05374 TaxID=2487420 RepID=UPI000F886F66|nr:hypothetical protein [Streptomyces sp. WAC05374]RST15166.1 hypothetical protein EF905_15590 [Streptomyces sp. WAC05374]TDF45298.1 hypothetical protein E2B92_13390 [Streptomyces sp. WAC05374]TDF55714.1 hypothetical protein E2C02_14310 [Streptomyces sp. WAC05374]TDF58852.1 hypothetical protein E2C00_07200 [Streptomyces sp. WAC05374]
MAVTGEKRAPTHARLVLAVGAVGVLINVADWFVGGDPQPYHVFPLLLVLWGAADLLKAARPAAARAVRGVAGVLTVAAGLAVGVPAAVALVRGESVDWLDLVLGVLVVLYAASAAAALAARRRAARP